jgi:hypothetical protein
VFALLAVAFVPIIAAARTQFHQQTIDHVAAARLGSPRFYDSATGYRESVLPLTRLLPRGSVVGGWQCGALSYFGGQGVTVVNLDGVVNPDAEAARDHLDRYLEARRVGYLADFPLAVLGLQKMLTALQPAPTARTVLSVPADGASPPYALVEVRWPPRSSNHA